MQFTNQEIDLIIEALDALKEKEIQDATIKGMLKAFAASTPKESQRAAEMMGEEILAIKAAHRQQEDEMILLKAKLIQMRPAAELLGVKWSVQTDSAD